MNLLGIFSSLSNLPYVQCVGNSAWQLSVYGSPHSTNSHTVSILYAIPVAAASGEVIETARSVTEGFIAEETNDGVEFHSLASAMEDEAVEHCDR